ncbi:ferredoxin [Mycolicibacterium sp. jd]|uniref:ferredoxin n=1 Tax=unclassified Mycolicibacterium TaxID=2636767 RepID=UPI00351BE1D0
MDITIDRDRCEGHGQCVAVAPDLFDLDDEGIAVLRVDTQAIPTDQAENAAQAVDVCPVAALKSR